MLCRVSGPTFIVYRKSERRPQTWLFLAICGVFARTISGGSLRLGFFDKIFPETKIFYQKKPNLSDPPDMVRGKNATNEPKSRFFGIPPPCFWQRRSDFLETIKVDPARPEARWAPCCSFCVDVPSGRAIPGSHFANWRPSVRPLRTPPL